MAVISKESVFLIIDDEPDMCWTLERILRQKGYASRTALDGAEALSLIERQNFQLAFLDAKLPDIEGLELARRIHTFNPDMPIVMVSGYFYKDNAAIEKACRDGLIQDFISKPFDHKEILKVVELLLVDY
jgi:DNA-binding NtrC family response regulator